MCTISDTIVDSIISGICPDCDEIIEDVEEDPSVSIQMIECLNCGWKCLIGTDETDYDYKVIS